MRLVWSACVVAAVSVPATVALGLPLAAPSAADTPLACDQNTLYGIDSSGNVDAINAASGATSAVRSMSPATNALGMTVNGADAIAFNGSTGQLVRYRTSDGTLSTFNNVDASAPASIIRGAVNPATGIYYYGGNGASAYLGAFDANTNTPIGTIGTINGLAASANGDFAFSTRGLLFVVSGDKVLRVDDPTVPTTTGSAALTTSLVATLPSGTNSPGIAFTTNGYLYVANGSTIIKLDPASGQALATTSLGGGFSPIDLASCNYPNTITAQASVSSRVSSGDQFGVSVTGGGIVSGNTATTSGSATGVQPQQAGPALAIPARTYTAAETAAGTTDLADYDTTYTCVNVNDSSAVTSGTGTTVSFSYPAPTTADGVDITCTFANTPAQATIRVGTALDGARNDSSDQFTVAVRSTSASGPVLNQTTASTTSGSASTVTSGTGTTGVTTVQTNRTYYLTQDLAGSSVSDPAQYGAQVTCTDGNNVQSGLPNNAVFVNSLAITPLSGSAIDCTITDGPVAPTLAVTAGLTSARYDDNDQFTVAVRSGDPNGPVLNSTANSTTAGTGATVTSGTGTTDDVTGTANNTYYVTQAISANAIRYTSTISCSDANGFQSGLPSGASFAGSLAITPVAGAAIDCAVSNAPAPAALVLAMTGPSQLVVGTPASYVLDVTNSGGSATPATVAIRLPAGLQYTSSTGTGWSCSPTGSVSTGQDVACSRTSLPAGAISGLTLVVTPQPGALGNTVVNRAAIDTTGGTTPPDPSTCVMTDAASGCAVAPGIIVTSGVNLTLDQTGPESLTPGAPSDYLLTVTNVGSGPASSATVVDALAAGMHYVGDSGAACASAGQVVTCTVAGPIAANGGTAAFTITATPDQSLAGDTVVNPAAVDPTGAASPIDATTCTATGAPTGCAVSSAASVVTPRLRLKMTGAPAGAAHAPVRRADRIAYRYTVTNLSSGKVRNLTVRGGAVGAITCTATTLAAGASTPCRADAEYLVSQADVDHGAVRQSAHAVADLRRCAVSSCAAVVSNAASVTTPTYAEPALAVVEKQGLHDGNGDGKANSGETIAYTITVTNTGNVTLTHVTVNLPGVTVTCPKTSLSPGRSMQCTATYVVTDQDESTGFVRTRATATASSVSSKQIVSGASRHLLLTAATASPTDSSANTTRNDPQGSGSSLASTGAQIAGGLGLGAGLLFAGVALLALARRRRPALAGARGRHRR